MKRCSQQGDAWAGNSGAAAICTTALTVDKGPNGDHQAGTAPIHRDELIFQDAEPAQGPCEA